MRKIFLGFTMVVFSTGAALAKPPLRDVAAIDNAVFDVAVADKIRKECPEISARFVQALQLYRATRSHARQLGYSDAEIEAYADSKVEKARMRAKGEAYLRSLGVVAGNAQSYCEAGRKEIQKSSRIGSLLREK